MSLFKKVLQSSPAYQAVKLGTKIVQQKAESKSTSVPQAPQTNEPITVAVVTPPPVEGNAMIMHLKGRGDKVVAENISPDEKILVKLQGDFGQALVMTNKRLYIVKWGMQTGSTFGGKCTSYEYRNISAIESRKHMTTRLVQILTPATQNRNLSYWGNRDSGNNAVESDSAITYSKKLDLLFQQAIEVARKVTEKSHVTNSSSQHNLSDVEQLEKLAELRTKGILTEEEFQAKKAKILDL